MTAINTQCSDQKLLKLSLAAALEHGHGEKIAQITGTGSHLLHFIAARDFLMPDETYSKIHDALVTLKQEEEDQGLPATCET